MSRKSPYPREVRDRAVKMVFEHRGEYASQWAAIARAEEFGERVAANFETLVVYWELKRLEGEA